MQSLKYFSVFLKVTIVLLLSFGGSVSKISCPIGSTVYLSYEVPILEKKVSCKKMSSENQCPLREKKQRKETKKLHFDFETFLSASDKVQYWLFNLSVHKPLITYIDQLKAHQHIFSGIPPPLLKKPTCSFLQSFLL